MCLERQVVIGLGVEELLRVVQAQKRAHVKAGRQKTAHMFGEL